MLAHALLRCGKDLYVTVSRPIGRLFSVNLGFALTAALVSLVCDSCRSRLVSRSLTGMAYEVPSMSFMASTHEDFVLDSIVVRHGTRERNNEFQDSRRPALCSESAFTVIEERDRLLGGPGAFWRSSHICLLRTPRGSPSRGRG